jgi:peptidyl-prolyl cis-trans isomerase C
MFPSLRAVLPALGAAAVLSAGLATAQTPPATPAPAAPAPAAGTPAADPVVAVVNGAEIKLSDLQRAQQGLPNQYRNLPLQMIYGALLDQLVDAKLAAMEGRKTKVQDDADFKRELAAYEESLVQRAWLQKEIDRRNTNDAVQQRYLKKVGEMPAEDEVKARHILVSSEDEAKAIIGELQKGADFEKIAREKSTDKASGAQGGDLGWFKKGDMVKEFADAAFAQEKGSTSKAPVKTQFGFHVIKTEDRRPAAPPTQADLADDVRAELTREIYTEIIEGLRKTAKVERFNMDGSKMTSPATPAPAPAQPPKN